MGVDRVARRILGTNFNTARHSGQNPKVAIERLKMARKTYLPGAVDIANKLHSYLTRYQETLTLDKTATQIDALIELIACLAAFLQNWRKPPPV
jgi:hypothetical protein